MKSIKRNLKWAAKILSFLILLQSCTVYHSSTASVDEAILSDDKVQIITTTDDIYKFKKLQREDDQIYGVTRIKSRAAKEYSDKIVPVNSDSKFVKIPLEEITINEIHLKNPKGSTAVTVLVPVVIVGVLVGIGVNAYNNISL